VRLVQDSFRIEYNSPEWQIIKRVLESHREVALQKLVATGLSEAEYNQWRGRVHLADVLLNGEKGRPAVTD